MEFDERGLVERLRAIDVECEEGQLFLRREILDNGRSRAYVNCRRQPDKKTAPNRPLLVDLWATRAPIAA